MRKFILVIIPVLALLAGAFYWLGSESKVDPSVGEALLEQVTSTDSTQIGRPSEKLTVTQTLPEVAISSLADDESIDNETVEEISSEYREFLVSPDSPVGEVIEGLIQLANKDDGDAMMALILHADNCRKHDGAAEYCPAGTELFDYGRYPAGKYILMRNAASKGNLYAMTILSSFAPSPFGIYTPEEMIENKQKRALFADVVTEHNEDVREFMDIAIQQLYLPALIGGAYFYVFSPIVDPSREKSALYIMAWSQITGQPIPDDLLVVVNSLDTSVYAQIEKGASLLAERYQEKNLK